MRSSHFSGFSFVCHLSSSLFVLISWDACAAFKEFKDTRTYPCRAGRDRGNLLPGMWRDYADKSLSTCCLLQPVPSSVDLFGDVKEFSLKNKRFIPDISAGGT